MIEHVTSGGFTLPESIEEVLLVARDAFDATNLNYLNFRVTHRLIRRQNAPQGATPVGGTLAIETFKPDTMCRTGRHFVVLNDPECNLFRNGLKVHPVRIEFGGALLLFAGEKQDITPEIVRAVTEIFLAHKFRELCEAEHQSS